MPVNRTPPIIGTEPTCKVCGKGYPQEECVSCEYCRASFHATCAGYVLPNGNFRCMSCQINFVCCVCHKTVQRDDHIICSECPNLCHLNCTKVPKDQSFRCDTCLKEEADLVTVSELGVTTQSQLEATIQELTKMNKVLESQLQQRDAQLVTQQLANLSLQPAPTSTHQMQGTPIKKNHLGLSALPLSVSPIISAVPYTSVIHSSASALSNRYQGLGAIPKNIHAHPGLSHPVTTLGATNFCSKPVTAISHPLMSSTVYGHVSAPEIASQSEYQAFTIQSQIGTYSHAGQSFIPPINHNGPTTATNTPHQYVPIQMLTRSGYKHDLPKFDGNPNDWPSFISIYEHSTSTYYITDQENLLRLKNSLIGIAYRHVASLLSIPHNVPYIIARLRMLFGRPEQLIECQLSQIRKLPNPSFERMSTLIDFGIAVHNLITSMQAAQQHDHLNNPMLLKELVDRLSPQLKLQWIAVSRTYIAPNLVAFDAWLDALTLDACLVTDLKPENENYRKNRNENRRVNVHQRNRSPSEENTRSCPICHKSCKSVPECSKFVNSDRNRRWDLARQAKLCRVCLRRHQGSCTSNQICGVNGCDRRHNRLLHSNHTTSNNPPVASHSIEVQTENNFTHQHQTDSMLFRILPVTLKNGPHSVNTFAFIDDGSSVTLIDQSLVNELHATGPVKPLCLQWTNNEKRMEPNSKILSLNVCGQYPTAKNFEIKNVRTVENLALPTQTVIVDEMMQQWKHLNGLPITSYRNARPMILIGIDNGHLGTPLRVKEGSQDDPIAIKSRLGWCIYGKLDDRHPRSFSVNAHNCPCEDEIDKFIRQSYELDNIGIVKHDDSLLSPDDKKALAILKKNTKRIENRFETTLLWSQEQVNLPDNKEMALQRLRCLRDKMERDPTLKVNLNQQIDEMQQLNYIRKLTNTEINNKTNKTWYLPVFPVVNPNKPTKIRLVWDFAATYKGISLNSMLLKGPDGVPLLTQPLFRFRERKFAISGDIKQMFMQVLIEPSDQEAQRFLWPNAQGSYDTFKMMRMAFGATCSPSTAQYVKNLNAREYEREYPRAARSIIENHYVDDLLDSFDTKSEALQVAKQIQAIHAHAGFHIRNWNSNSEEVCNELCSNSGDAMNLDFGEKFEKLLGMWWSPKDDCFTYVVKYTKINEDVLTGKTTPTKRDVLRLAMSVFDPNGFICFFTIHLKILMQDLWRTGCAWDETIDDSQAPLWFAWLKRLPEIAHLKIPRCYVKEIASYDDATVELHVFTDGGADAYAAVAYFRIKTGNYVEVVLVGAKAKVNPIKRERVPRLELQGALMGARYAQHLKNTHTMNINNTYFWTDSMVVLGWLRANSRQYSQYVAFRTSEIQEITTTAQWRYVPTKLNPADAPTKITNKPNLQTNTIWFTGPRFLKMSPESWPTLNEKTVVVAPDEEKRPVCHHLIQEPIIDISRFSEWQKAVKTIVYMYRYIDAITKPVPNRTSFITSNELKRAESLLFKIAQHEIYSEEIQYLENERKILKSSTIYNLTPVLDENGILRMDARTKFAFVPLDNRQPIILPRKHMVTRVLIESYHRRHLHQFSETVVNEMRKRFYIPKLRRAVQEVVKMCQTCKNNKAKIVQPQMAPLPIARLAVYTPPFTHTGIDYFGPILVAVKRSQEKRWGVLYTCLTTRAIHVEVAHKLDAGSCIMALRRFEARRGMPRCYYSDRGTNLIATERILKEEIAKLNMSDLAQQVVSTRTEWKFNPPLAPNMGGAWERMIQTFKRALYAALPEKTCTDEILLSAFAEIENIVNARPLTYLPIDSQEMEAITPNHFLRATSTNDKLPDLSDDQETLINTWKVSQTISKRFWKRWLTEYLPELTRRAKWQDKTTPLQIDDIVIIIDPNSAKNSWPKGRVVEVYESNDGMVRSAKVKTLQGFLTRPASKLAKLDVVSAESL